MKVQTKGMFVCVSTCPEHLSVCAILETFALESRISGFNSKLNEYTENISSGSSHPWDSGNMTKLHS